MIVLSLIGSLCGVFSSADRGSYEFTSLHGEKVTIFGKGIYQHESVSVASQAIAQDIVTIVLGFHCLSFHFS